MKNARTITTLSSPFLIFLLISTLFLTVSSTESSQSLVNSEDSSSDSVMEPPVENDNGDWIVTPGSTKLLLIKLTGRIEEILFEFSASEIASSTFQVSTIVNKISESRQTKQFLQEETLSVNLDYESKEVYILGDNEFSISYPIQEENYDVNVTQQRYPNVNSQVILMAEASTGSNTTAIFGAVGGSCGLVTLMIAFVVIWKKRKAVPKENLAAKSTGSTVLGEKLNTETPYTSKPFTTESLRKDRSCEVKNCSKGPDFEIGANLSLDCKAKKESSTSQASTLATTGRIESQESTKSFLSSNLKGVSEGDNLCETDFETITEVGNEEKHSPYASILEKPSTQNKKLIINNNNTILKSQETGTVKKIEKPVVKRKSKSLLELEVALDMDFEVDAGERRMPTLTEIKSLIRKMEEEGTIGNDCDPSEDTDDEDQYEAPVLPNYFCCMLCFEGRRCTVVEPCRHVFACDGCVRELLDSYKICVLCANTITSYEPL